MPIEFFQCPCPERGNVILNGKDQGPNKDESGKLLTKQCNTGLSTIALKCKAGKTCTPVQVIIEIKDTDPISPMEVAFRCEN